MSSVAAMQVKHDMVSWQRVELHDDELEGGGTL